MRNGEADGNVVGLIPAAGLATRLAPLPCSKEIFPVGFWRDEKGLNSRPKVACHYLLEKMRAAGVRRAYMVLRCGKWDIPAYLGDGSMLGMDLAYLIARVDYGSPYSLDQAFPFVKDAIVVLGFADILFGPDDAIKKVLLFRSKTGVDIVLGLHPAEAPSEVDMVELDDHGRVIAIVAKPLQTELKYTWTFAVWTPKFTRFLHAHLAERLSGMAHGIGLSMTQPELSVGDVVQSAIKNGLSVLGLPFPTGRCADIGTSGAHLESVVRQLANM